MAILHDQAVMEAACLRFERKRLSCPEGKLLSLSFAGWWPIKGDLKSRSQLACGCSQPLTSLILADV